MREGFKEQKKIKPAGKVKRFFKTLARKTILPLAVTGCLAFPPIAKHINPFHSKPALADEPAKKSKKDKLKDLYIGGTLIANEAGASVAGNIFYKPWVGFDLGVIMFGNEQSPFGTLTVMPGLEKKGVKFRYFGKLTFVNLNSYLHTSHSLSLGYGKQFEKWGFDLGVVAGGALSYPVFDNIYFNMAGGVSFNYNEMIYVYALAKSYFAAGNAMQSSYVGYYSPKWQGIEAGALVKVKEITAKLYWDYDVVQSKGGLVIGTQLNFSPKIKGFLGGGIGVSWWSEELGGHANFMANAVLNIYIAGDSGVNQMYKASYERLQKGSIPLQTDINSPPQLRPLTLQERAWEATAANRLISSGGNMDTFAGMYAGASLEELRIVARWLSRLLGEVAYANGVQDLLFQGKFSDPAVQKVANASHDDILGALRKYVQWYQINGTYAGMPDYLKNQITMCGGIHSTAAAFLVKNGVKAAAITVNTPTAGHFVTAYWTDSMTGIIDYGDEFIGPGNSLDELIRAYGEYREAPTFISQIFIPNNDGSWDYKGTWLTPEGRLIQYTFGIDNFHIMRSYLLDIAGY